MTTGNSALREIADQDYKYGFVTDIEAETAPRGLNEDIIRWISAKKEEPDWMLEWRLKAFHYWRTQADQKQTPSVGQRNYRNRVFRDMTTTQLQAKATCYRAWIEVDDELLRRAFEKLGIPLEEQKALGWGRRRRHLRCVSSSHHLPGDPLQAWGHRSAPMSEANTRVPRTGSRSIWDRWCPHADNFYPP